MNLKLRLAAYAVLIMLAAWFGHRFYRSYQGTSGGEKPAAHASHKKATNVVAAATNVPALDTNAVATDTNAASVATNTADQAAATNTMAQSAPPDTNQAATAAAAAADQDPTTMAQTISGKEQGTTIINLALFIVSVLGLGLLVAHDITVMVGAKAGDYLFSNVGDAQRDPEYEKAEQVWANGKHLEAIQLLRDYYKRNPRQVHAALRIAEIYEKDLRNYLAAALEYEEVLKHKLPSDRWAWAAIHLCNLYSRLGQQDKTLALLRRIAEEHPKSAAAKKARQRLGLPEPEETEPVAAEPAAEPDPEAEATFEVTDDNLAWPTEPGSEPEPPAQDPKSNLPPGFRPKK